MLNYFSTKVTSKKYGFKSVNYFCYFMKDAKCKYIKFQHKDINRAEKK